MSDTSEAVTIDVEDALRKVERSNREKYFLSLGCLKKGKIYNPQLKVPGDATPDYVCLPVTCYTAKSPIKTKVSETSRNEGVLCKGGGSFYIIGQVRDGSAEYLFYVDKRKKKTCMIRCWCGVLQSLEAQTNGTVLNYFKVIATGTRAIEDMKTVMEMVMIYLSPSEDSRVWVPKNGLSFEDDEVASEQTTSASQPQAEVPRIPDPQATLQSPQPQLQSYQLAPQAGVPRISDPQATLQSLHGLSYEQQDFSGHRAILVPTHIFYQCTQ